MKVLELFSGTASFSRVAESRGHECRTLDNDPRFKPTYCMDIMDFTIDKLGDWRPDVIWASPPCQCFSIMVVSKNWTKNPDGTYTPKRPETIQAMEIVKKTLAIIEELKPKYYFIENPRAMLRKQPFMSDIPRKTVTYCKYGLPYQKATEIWTNCEKWVPKTPCSANDPCHVRAPRGSRYGIQGVDGLRKNREQKHFDVSRMRDTPVHYGWWKRNDEQPTTKLKLRESLHPRDIGGDYNWNPTANIKRAIVPSELCEEIIKAIE